MTRDKYRAPSHAGRKRSRAWAARAVALADAEVPELLSPRRAAALDRMAAAHAEFEEALAFLIARDDVVLVARLVRALRSYWQERGLVDEGRAWMARALAMPAAAAPTDERATLLDQEAVLAASAGDYRTARTLVEEAVALRSRPGRDALLPNMLAHLALIIRAGDGDLAQARTLLERAVTLGRERGNAYILRGSLYRLAQVCLDLGDLPTARRALAENVAVARANADEWALGLVIGAFAALAAQSGSPQRALRLAAAARRPGVSLGGGDATWLEQMLAPARRALGEEAQAAAWAAGGQLQLDEALEYALADDAP